MKTKKIKKKLLKIKNLFYNQIYKNEINFFL